MKFTILILTLFVSKSIFAVDVPAGANLCAPLLNELGGELKSLARAGFWKKESACFDLQNQEQLCSSLANSFHKQFPRLADSPVLEKPFCMKNKSSKGLFSETIQVDPKQLSAAQKNYCNITPGWRICFVCNVLISKDPESTAIKKCAPFIGENAALIETFSKQTKNETVVTPGAGDVIR